MSEGTIFTDATNSFRDYCGADRRYRLKSLNSSLMMDSMDLASSDLSNSIPDYVSTSEMSVRALISTPDIDRYDEIVIPAGIQLTNYRINPAVMWAHGLEDGLTKPLGKAEDPNGNLEMLITPQGAVSKCWFSRSDLVAAQIFELIAERIIRGVSIRETPISSHKDVKNGRRVIIVDSCDLEEWSFCALAVLPQATAKAVDRNRLDGRPIHPSIMKSLNAMLPPKQATGIGFVEPKTDSVIKSEDSNMADETDKDKKTPEETPKDEATDKTPADSKESGNNDASDGSVCEGMDSASPGDPDEDNKLGRQGIEFAHESMKSMRAGLRSCCKSMEEPDVKGHLQGIHDGMDETMTGLAGLRKEKYPASSELKSEDMNDAGGGSDEDSGDADSAMKSMMSAINSKRLTFVGALEGVKSVLASCKSLSTGERKRLMTAVEQFTRLDSQSKSYRAKPVEKPIEKPSVTAEQQSAIDAAFALLKS